MGYVLLIVEPAGQRQERTEAEGRELYDRMVNFSADLKARRFSPCAIAHSGQNAAHAFAVEGNRHSVVDGPFSEAKEMIGGFFLLTCETREQAIAIAPECPAAQWATIEVRELGPCFT